MPRPELPEGVKRPEPPKQKAIVRACIRPQKKAEVVVDQDLIKDFIDVRESMILDIEPGGRLVMAQTSPPLFRSHAGHPIEITFLSLYRDVPGGRWLRAGYRTDILAIDNDYQLQGMGERVFLVEPPQELELSTVRLHYRVTPPLDYPLKALLLPRKLELGIINLSRGGMLFSHPTSINPNLGQYLQLALVGPEMQLILKGQVVRAEPAPKKGAGIASAAVMFVEMEPESKRLLSEVISEVSRLLLARRSGLQE